MKLFNLIRYVLGIVVPSLICFLCSGEILVVAVFAFLFFNNVVDDYIFYYGSSMINGYKNNGVVSPVEGIVTRVENDVELYSHLEKSDILSKECLVKADIKFDCKKYSHITIFLNKFNKHAVLSLMDGAKMVQHKIGDENFNMVEDGCLISDNVGRYLTNTFVELIYPNDVHVIVTMDKYISKAVVPTNRKSIEMLICRGSQCDIYVPNSLVYDEGSIVKINQHVEIGQTLYNVASECIDIDKENYKKEVIECIANSGFNAKYAIIENLKKTAKTIVHSPSICLLLFVIALITYTDLMLMFGVYLFMFMLDRNIKNLFYSLMNIIGYKDWMTKYYKVAHKMLLNGK